jgi:hypothetical protein
MTDRRYPIGPIALKDAYSDDEIREFIRIIAEIPAEYRKRVANLSDEDLLKTYREGSWNIRQLIHHVGRLAICPLPADEKGDHRAGLRRGNAH